LAEENIKITVSDEELDAAIAKLDEALEKTEHLEQIPKTEVGTSEATAKLDDLEAHAAEVEANVDDTMATGTVKLDNLEVETEVAKTSVDDVATESEGMDIKGLDSASHRIIRMIPGLREAQRIQRSLGALSEGSIMGVLGLLLVAYSIYKEISRMLAEQQQQADEYKKEIMEIRGFTMSAQFEKWQEDQRRIIEGYRSGIIP
jgi:hypothetical protein